MDLLPELPLGLPHFERCTNGYITAKSVSLRKLLVHSTEGERASTTVLVPEVTSLPGTSAVPKPFISSGQDCATKSALLARKLHKSTQRTCVQIVNTAQDTVLKFSGTLETPPAARRPGRTSRQSLITGGREKTLALCSFHRRPDLHRFGPGFHHGAWKGRRSGHLVAPAQCGLPGSASQPSAL